MMHLPINRKLYVTEQKTVYKAISCHVRLTSDIILWRYGLLQITNWKLHNLRLLPIFTEPHHYLSGLDFSKAQHGWRYWVCYIEASSPFDRSRMTSC